MTDRATLLALAARVEAATGPDRELDRAISRARAAGDDIEAMINAELNDYRFTASLDAALSLVPEGTAWTLGQNVHHRYWAASLNVLGADGEPQSIAWGQAAAPRPRPNSRRPPRASTGVLMSISIPVPVRTRRAFADTIYSIRVNNKQTQVEVSTLLGVSKASYLNWERGRSFPTLGNLYALCQLWRMPVSSLFLSAERRIHHAPLSRARRGRKQPPCTSIADPCEK